MSTLSSGLKFRIKKLGRRLSAPALNRVDGRVWNINWRIEHAWDLIRAEGRANRETVSASVEQMSSSLATYARSVEESSSYVALELRRLDSALAAQEDLSHQLATNMYREKVAQAQNGRLAALDSEIAGLVNYAVGHQGFAAQAHLWFNPPAVVELSTGAARLSVVNERIVEMPFAFAALGRIPKGSRLIEIGSGESTFALSAAGLGYAITAIDLRAIPFQHPKLTSFAGRFEDWQPPRAKFDAAFLISTIEHVGIGGYGENPFGDGAPGTGADRSMIEQVARLLNRNGLLVLTTPFGPVSSDDFERTYDDPAIDALLDGWTIIERSYAIRQSEVVWEASEKPAPEDHGVVMIVATPYNDA